MGGVAWGLAFGWQGGAGWWWVAGCSEARPTPVSNFGEERRCGDGRGCGGRGGVAR